MASKGKIASEITKKIQLSRQYYMITRAPKRGDSGADSVNSDILPESL
jgi:hypothetical protein